MRRGLWLTLSLTMAAMIGSITTPPADAPLWGTPATSASLVLAAQGEGAVVRARPDRRWKFYTGNKRRYSSPWYDGQWRTMIPYGCTPAPYYSADPRCRDRRGFHHGVDVAMPCGTKLFAGYRGWVIGRSRYGPAYGVRPVVLRNYRHRVDILLAHTRKTYVRPGQRIKRGQLLARASDSAAPDGCHLHFEVRRMGGGLSSALRPYSYVKRSRA